MNQHLSIVLILPYFGKFPHISPWFFYSCSKNKNLTILLFTDQPCPVGLSYNVKYIPFTKKGFTDLVKRATGISCSIKYPYKLCDFKPIYGHIFSSYIKDFDFWGYCDMDMIFGGSSRFLTKKVLEDNDIITSRKNLLAGNFTLYRNTSKINNLYAQSDIWEKVLTRKWKMYNIDEQFKPLGKPAPNNLLLKKMVCVFMKKGLHGKLPDMNSIIQRNLDVRVCYLDAILSDEFYRQQGVKNWKVHYKNGKLTDHDGKEGLYFHFYRVKNLPEFDCGPANSGYSKTITLTNEALIK